MGRINWQRIDEDDFNDIVEALLVREHTRDGLEAHALSGRGGDDGIDVEIRVKKTNKLVHTFQLKYFPGGFSGGHTNRRTQIKRSLHRAIAAETPPVWTLVVPTNPTARERKAVKAMRNGEQVTIRFMGPAELDGLLARHPDIEDRFTSDRAVELLTAVHRPEAALTKPDDLHSEVSRLQSRLGGRSEYWAPSVSFGPDGTYIETLHALRDDAHEREPLSISVSLGFNPDDTDLRQQFEQSMKFGTIDPLLLPERVVRAFDKVGPEWFAEKGAGGSLEIWPSDEEHTPATVRVETRNPDGPVAAALAGRTVSRAAGFDGATVRVSLEGGITQTWRFPGKTDDTGSVSSDNNFAGSSAREIRRALRFLGSLGNHSQIGISIADSSTLWMDLGLEAAPASDTAFASFIDDLCALEDYFDVTLRYPAASVDASDRLWARILVMMIRGEAVAHPNAGTFDGTLNGTLDEGLEMLLRHGAAIFARSPDFIITLFGTPLRLNEIAYYSHSATADNAEQVLTDLKKGRGEGEQIAIRPANGLPWVIYSPEHFEAAGHTVVVTKPWSIEGISEHPQYNALPSRLENQGKQVSAQPD